MSNPYSGQIFSELVSGNLFQADQITGPFICIVGTASSGPSYTLKRVSSAQEAATLFEEDGDTDTPFLRDIALALQEGGEAITLYAMRIGGTQGSLLFTQASATGTLKITPQYEDAEAFDKYKIALMESTLTAGTQRVLIYDDDLDAVIFDSDLIIVPDLGLVKVELSSSWDGHYEFGLDTNSQPDFEGTAPTLTELHTTPGTYFSSANHSGTDTAALTTKVDPTDGKNLSKPAMYACLEKAYGLISTRYMDFIVPSGVYFDAANITDTTDGRDISQATSSQKVYDSDTIDWSDSTLIEGDATKDILGYLWQYKYKGTKYTFMTHASDLFTGTVTLDTIADIGGTRAAVDGTFKYAPGGNPSNSFTIEVDWAAMVKLLTVESGGNVYKVKNIELDIVNSANDSDGSAHGLTTTCHLDEDFDTTTETLTLRLAADVTGNGPTIPLSTVQTVLEASDYISAVKFYSATGTEITATLTSADYFHTLSSDYSGTPVKVGQYWLTHKELTGEEIPSKVWDKFKSNGSNSQLREVNFGHQLAQFCYYASTSYHMCLGFISFSKPDSFNKTDLANYMGALPEYQGWGGKLTDEAIKSVGEGILGNKFLSGSIGYRGNELKGGSASQGYAFGGLICTKGLSLPNKQPYGIAQGDEKKDANKFPVDIGRHIVVSASWPICSFSLSGTTIAARHSISSMLAAKVFVTPVNQEPFGEVNGSVRANVLLSDSEQQLVADGYAGDCRIARITMLDSAAIGGNNYITNISTAAHWKDDYKRISTIRCVNRVVNGLRNLAKRYIGSSFSSAMITSLQSAINGYLKSEQDVGVHQGAVATLSYTRADRINGNLKITLKMVPPFALETITITTSVAADASEL
tara:strand:+ start:1545 stop:4139 length:2595 start_codon:yes stop_codon:yes gene_type:complete